jgi:hypothetical protein
MSWKNPLFSAFAYLSCASIEFMDMLAEALESGILILDTSLKKGLK